MDNDNPPTITDVAELAHVSIATVSRVINNSGTVKKKNIEKVSNAIDQLGYRPHAIAQSLKKKSTKLIGCILSDISNTYLIQVAKAIEEVISPYGYNLIMSSHEGKANLEEKQINALLEINAAGIILNTTGFNDDLIVRTMNRVPTVLIHRDIFLKALHYDFVDSDNVKGAYVLTKKIIQKGHTRIGVINGLLEVSSGRDRYNGFLKAIEEEKISNCPVFNGDFTIESGYSGAKFLTSLNRDMTALIVMNNNMAIGAMRYLFQQSIDIPSELSFASYGDIMNIELLKKKPLIISLDPEKIGWKAGEFLIDRIAAPKTPSRRFLLEPQLVDGETLAVIQRDHAKQRNTIIQY